jgi:hypothetical protein
MGPIPNPQSPSPIPNPQSPVLIEEKRLIFAYIEFIEKIIGLFKLKSDELKGKVETMLNNDKPTSIKYIELVKYYLNS